MFHIYIVLILKQYIFKIITLLLLVKSLICLTKLKIKKKYKNFKQICLLRGFKKQKRHL